MSLRVTNIVSQILCKDYDTKNKIILNPGGSEIFFSDSDTPTKGNADNKSYRIQVENLELTKD